MPSTDRRPPGYGALGRVLDEPTRSTLRAQADRISDLERRLQLLEENALQQGSPVDAYGQRVTEVADPTAAQDAVNLRTVKRLIATEVAVFGQETAGGTDTTPPPAPAPGPAPVAGQLVVLGRGFARDGVRYDWRGLTLFPHLANKLRGVEFYGPAMTFIQQAGLTVPRILLSTGSAFWDGSGFGLRPPDFPNYFTALRAMLEEFHSLGVCPQLVVFGDCHTIYTTPSQRTAFVQQVANALIPVHNCFIEIANEASAINIPPAETNTLAAAYLAVDPRKLVSAGGAHAGDSNSLFFNVAPNRYLPYQGERTTADSGWAWVTQHYGKPPVTQTDRPPVEEEPMNAGTIGNPDQWDDSPDRWYGVALLSRFLQFSMTFHSDWLFRYGTVEQLVADEGDGSFACFAAWQQGLTDQSFDIGGTLWAVTGSGAVGDSPISALGGATLIVGRHNGAFGQGVVLRAPAGWAPTAAAGWTVMIETTIGACRRVRVVRS